MTTPTGSGTDIVSLGISVDATQPTIAIEALDKLGAATVKTVKSIDELSDASQKNSKWIADSNEKYKTKIQLLEEQWRAEQKAINAEKEYANAIEKTVNETARFLTSLQQTVDTLGMTQTELLRFTAAQLNAAAEAEPLIAALERETIGLKQLEYAAFRSMEANEALYLKTTAAAEYSSLKVMEANEAVFLKKEAQRKLDEAALEAHVQKEIAANSAITRSAEYAAEKQMLAHEQVYLRGVAANEKKIVDAEKSALADIRYAEMTTKAKIAELEKLAQYRAADAVRPETLNSMFSQAAQRDLQNYNTLLAQHTREMEAKSTVTKKVHGDVKNMAEAFEQMNLSSSRARSELIVLAHEAVQGRFSRMPASMMVLAEYTNAASLAFTGMGAAALGTVLALAGVSYEMAKGSAEVVKFNKTMALTGGFAGQTRDSLHDMAEELRGYANQQIGTTTHMLTALIETGKFSNETLKAVARTALEFQMLSGQSTEEVVRFFEGMSKVHGKVFNDMTNHVADWAAKANERYHFLSAAQYEHIRLLGLQGEGQKAIIEIADKMHESFDDQDRRIGILVASYRGWVMILQDVTHWLQNVGKDWFNGSTKQGVVDIETKKWENLIKLRMEAKNGRAANPTTGDPGVQANPSEVAMYDKLVRAQNEVVKKAQAEFDKEALLTREKADRALANQEGVEAQRYLDYLDKTNKTKKEKIDDQIEHILDTTMRVNKSNMLEWEKNYKGEKDNMQRDMELAIQKGDLKVINEEDTLKRISEVKEKYKERGGSHSEDPDGKIAAQLADVDAAYKLAQQTTENNAKLTKKAMDAGKLEQDVGYKQLKDGRDKELVSLEEWYKARNAILDKYSLKKDAKLRADTDNKFKDNKADIANATAQDEATRIKEAAEAYDRLSRAIDNANKAEVDRLDKAIAKQKEHNEEIGKTKEQIQLARAQRDEQLSASNQLEADAIQMLLDGEVVGIQLIDTDRDLYTKRLEFLNQVIAKQKELSRQEKEGAAKEAISPEKYGKDADKLAKQWQTAGSSIAKSLTDAFGKGGKAAGEMFKAFAQGQANQLEINKVWVQERAAAVGLENEYQLKKEADDKKNIDSSINQIQSWGGMTDAASGYFAEGSKGYQAMQAAAKVLHTAELALQIVKGVNAVLTQGEGDPYTAFARMAAMAAIVTGLGVAISSGGIGGGGKTAKEVQATQAAGTVFGNSDANSESIKKSIELMSKNSVLSLSYSANMLEALRAIEASMKGLTNLVARTDGLVQGTNLGIKTGQLNAVGSPTDVISRVGTAFTEAIFGPQIGGKIASFINNLWGKVKSNIVDSGLQFGGSVNSLQAGQGYNQYASVDVTKSSFFGLSKKTTNRVETQGLSSEISQQFGLIFTNLEESLKVAAVGIGLTADSVSKALDGLTIQTTKISLKDLKGDDLTAAINGVISKTMDQMAEAAFKSFDKFRNVGEGYAETVMRVANETVLVKDIYQLLGKTMNKTGLAGVELSQDLIKVSGGIDALVTNSKFFSDNFMTAREKITPVANALKAQLAELGMSHLTTVDMYKKEVIAALDGTAAGNKLYASLLKLGPAFDMVADFEAERYGNQLDLQLKIAQMEKKGADVRAIVAKQREIELSKLDDSLKPLQMRVWALEDEAQAVADVTEAKSKLNEAYNREKDSLQGTIDAMTDLSKSLTDFANSLLLGSESTLTPEQKYMEASTQYERNLSLAKGGDKDAQGKLQEMASALLSASQVVNSNDDRYVQDFQKVQDDLRAGAAWAQDQADVAKASLAALEKQVQGLIDVKEEVTTVAQAIQELVAAMAPRTTTPTSENGSLLTPLGQVLYNSPAATNDALLSEMQAMRTELNLLREERLNGDAQNTSGQIATASLISKEVGTIAQKTTTAAAYNMRLREDTKVQ